MAITTKTLNQSLNNSLTCERRDQPPWLVLFFETFVSTLHRTSFPRSVGEVHCWVGCFCLSFSGMHIAYQSEYKMKAFCVCIRASIIAGAWKGRWRMESTKNPAPKTGVKSQAVFPSLNAMYLPIYLSVCLLIGARGQCQGPVHTSQTCYHWAASSTQTTSLHTNLWW